jgi:predicted nucleotidyltransferase
MIIIMKTLFGSQLYGTATEDSDTDYKGVFLPTKEQILLGKIPKSVSENTKKDRTKKNSSTDVDCQLFSLHYFIHLACQGETAALDMLYATDKTIVWQHPIWATIIEYREKFHTKNLKAFIGYAQRQAAKYGVKGSRLNAAKKVMDFLGVEILRNNGSTRLIAIWDKLPEGEHIHKYVDMYEFCNKKMNKTVTVDYAYSIVSRFHDNYGERAKLAAGNEGIDWKAISHALRAAYQVKEVLTEGTITFSLKHAELIKQIKQGCWNFSNVMPMLEDLIEDCKELSEKSSLPEKVDTEFWDKLIIDAIETYVL